MKQKTAAPQNFEKLLKASLGNAPIGRFLGRRLIVCKGGRAEVRLPYRAEFQQGDGVVHGGIIATLVHLTKFIRGAIQ
jgi:acyl-coenzyme A thioesterase PaaI-like protein